MIQRSYKIILITLFFALIGCEDRLEEKLYSQLAPSTLFNTEKGLENILKSSYAYSHRDGIVSTWSPFFMSSMPTGEVWGQGGSIETNWQKLMDFTWDSNHLFFQIVWQVHFNAIRDANIVMDNLDNENFSEEFKDLVEAEAHFIRGWNYSELFYLFGRLPLYKTSLDDPLLKRSTEEETINFIEQELLTAVATLPNESAQFGRASKGIALAVLSKFYLNTKQWEKAAETARQVIGLGQYSLLSNYGNVFDVENEMNDEIIWAFPKDPALGPSSAQALNALIFPTNFPMPYPNNAVFAARTYLFDEIIDKFENGDERLNQIITQYTATNNGEVVMGYGNDKSFPYKFPFDPQAQGAWAGNDVIVIRYSDILLTLAEALNEINGPTEESVALINQVRQRAHTSPLVVSNFTKETLRETILEERVREFYFEMKSREDQIRQGVFISRAQDRGKSAQEYHKLFPIPQLELDANPVMEQNPGY